MTFEPPHWHYDLNGGTCKTFLLYPFAVNFFLSVTIPLHIYELWLKTRGHGIATSLEESRSRGHQPTLKKCHHVHLGKKSWPITWATHDMEMSTGSRFTCFSLSLSSFLLLSFWFKLTHWTCWIARGECLSKEQPSRGNTSIMGFKGNSRSDPLSGMNFLNVC